MKSMSTESQRSSVSSGSNTQKQVAFLKPMGGSYSSKTGASSQIIRETLNTGEGENTPKLAQVARALMAAKAAGELPQASKKDLELQTTYRLAQQQKLQQQQENQQGQNGKATRPQPQSQNGQAAHPK